MNIILLGGPGSGKGTQADQLKAKLGLTHISTGDLFREHIGNNTKLGLKAQEYINRGELVPDNITIAMVRDRLMRPDIKKGIIFDGFPRTRTQAEALDSLMDELGDKIDVVLCIIVSDDEIVDRLSGRMICQECKTPFHTTFNPFTTCPYNKCQGEYLCHRDDDKPETVRARLKTYHDLTKPLIDYYQDADMIKILDGEKSIEDVTNDALESVQALKH